MLLDLDLGAGPDGEPMNGVDLIVPLRAQGWTVLVITGATDLDRVAEAVAHGAANWVVEGANFPELLSTVAEMTAGGASCRRASGGTHQALPGGDGDASKGRRADEALSPREREVLARLTEGATAGTIAAETHTSIRTVQTHIHRILTKLEVSSQLAATGMRLATGDNRRPSGRVSGGRCAESGGTPAPSCRSGVRSETRVHCSCRCGWSPSAGRVTAALHRDDQDVAVVRDVAADHRHAEPLGHGARGVVVRAMQAVMYRTSRCSNAQRAHAPAASVA